MRKDRPRGVHISSIHSRPPIVHVAIRITCRHVSTYRLRGTVPHLETSTFRDIVLIGSLTSRLPVKTNLQPTTPSKRTSLRLLRVGRRRIQIRIMRRIATHRGKTSLVVARSSVLHKSTQDNRRLKPSVFVSKRISVTNATKILHPQIHIVTRLSRMRITIRRRDPLLNNAIVCTSFRHVQQRVVRLLRTSPPVHRTSDDRTPSFPSPRSPSHNYVHPQHHDEYSRSDPAHPNTARQSTHRYCPR